VSPPRPVPQLKLSLSRAAHRQGGGRRLVTEGFSGNNATKLRGYGAPIKRMFCVRAVEHWRSKIVICSLERLQGLKDKWTQKNRMDGVILARTVSCQKPWDATPRALPNDGRVGVLRCCSATILLCFSLNKINTCSI